MSPLTAIRGTNISCQLRNAYRAFSAYPTRLEKPLPPRIVVPESDIDESFLKGSGPGGQKINKTSSAVQLKHLPTGIVVKSQETRSRAQNRKIARRILGERLEELEKGDQSRTALKAESARKKKASASKKSRRKYRQSDKEKGIEEHQRRVEDDTVSEAQQAMSDAPGEQSTSSVDPLKTSDTQSVQSKHNPFT